MTLIYVKRTEDCAACAFTGVWGILPCKACKRLEKIEISNSLQQSTFDDPKVPVFDVNCTTKLQGF